MGESDQSGCVLGESGLTLPLPSGEAYFNYYWLRDACPSNVDPQTRERIFHVSSLSSPPRAQEVRIEGDELIVEWGGEDHVSRIPLDFLTAFARDGDLPDPAALPRRKWFSDHYASIARIDRSEAVKSDSGRARLARALIEDGIALVTGMSDSNECLDELVESLGPLTSTAEGFHFDVKVEIAPTNLAFTSKALELHTDMPGEEAAPGIQFLHCRANSVEGGHSVFADGVAVAEALREEDPKAFDLLSTHRIGFHYLHDGWHYRARQLVIELDDGGEVSGLTVSHHLQENLALPQPVLDEYYPALCKFSRMLEEERFACRFRLNAGECVVFDNHRIAHGREEYSATSGERRLRGCYCDRGALRSSFRILAKRGFDGLDSRA